MKNFVFFLTILFLGVFAFSAVKTADIESVRARTDGSSTQLSTSDQTVVRNFWENALNTMQLTDDPQEVVAIRRQIEQQISVQPLSPYATAYISAADEYLPTAFDNVSRFQDPKKKQLLEQNLMILTAHLAHIETAHLAIDKVDQKDPVVRYWAVKALTNAGVIQMLSEDIFSGDEIKENILNALRQRIEFENQIEIKTMIVKFAAAINHPTSREILLTIADQRIAAYNSWSDVNVMLDSKLLIAMGNIAMNQTNEVKVMFAQKFSVLLALAFQRYELGKDVLSEQQYEQTMSVIAEVDRNILAKMLGEAQTNVLANLQKSATLNRVYEMIFGNRLQAGDLAAIYNFDYGKDASGKAITAPPQLPSPPAKETEAEE